MGVRIFLLLVGLGSAPYGIYCAINPGFLEGFAGVAATSTTGKIELVAMYGGLQTGLGILALCGAFRPAYVHAALINVAFLLSGLGLFRLYAALSAGEFSSYTVQGMAFELTFAAIAIFLLRRRSWVSSQ